MNQSYPPSYGGSAEAPPPPAPPAPIAREQTTAAPARRPVSADAPSATQVDLAGAERILRVITESYSTRIVGQDQLRTSLLIALIAGGNILFASVPGLAKTTAASTLAHTV